MSNAPRTVAVVLNWRRPEDTLACVASLAAIDRPLDIVVVDNDSQDGSYQRIRDGLPGALPPGCDMQIHEAKPAPAQAPWRQDGGRTLILTDSGHNGGYASGNNVGAALALQQASTAYVWILNNDTLVPDAGSLDALVARMDEDAGLGICGSTVVYVSQSGHDGQQRIQTRGGCRFEPWRGRFMPIGAGESPRQSSNRGEVEAQLAYINGASAFVRRAVYDTVGPMREDHFLYYEEYDWARRLAGRFRLGYAPESLVYHEVGGTIGTGEEGGGSPLSIYYLTRNRLRTLGRHAPLTLIPALADEAKELFKAWRRGWQPQKRARIRALLGLGL
ncbi:glycosyltransferase family 2 protein [Novosphingobium rosa]|uniref:glycosyltransferase family 2 protein n=1 Tax=Novosphingobium rosa TaxID=76978 RepID=UPI000834E515|nr:glycosyltransferase family 2 protein [Novosphingobium rosa]